MGYRYSIKDSTCLSRFIYIFYVLPTLLAINSFFSFWYIKVQDIAGITMLTKASCQPFYSDIAYHQTMRSPRIQTNVIIMNKISTGWHK